MISSAFYQGGLSSSYKNYLAEKELPDDTYNDEALALFRVQGSGPENMQSIQVEPVSPVLHLLSPPPFPIKCDVNSFLNGFRSLRR